MNKSEIRDNYLNKLFRQRKSKAREEYLEAVSGTPFEKQLVCYKFKLFDATGKVKRGCTDIYNVPEGSDHARKLDRLIRVLDDIDVATRLLTYVLNSIEHEEEFNYLLKLSDKKLDPTIECKLDKFKEDNAKLFSTLNKFRLLADIV